jgi:hypothetical protein
MYTKAAADVATPPQWNLICRSMTSSPPVFNARQYSFATFPSHGEKFAARFKSVCNFFTSKIT